MVKISDKIKSEIEKKFEGQTKSYSDVQLGKIIDILMEEIERLSDILDKNNIK